MTYVPITPFRRTVDAAVIKHQKYAQAPLPPEGVNKWEALRELAAARKHFGLTDRELGVLQALLSFHPETILGGNSDNLLVYPSNAAICERLNGMACSTMRRHLSGLVQSGLILRRDSPNGKRYVKRHGADAQAFGFDLTPLAARFAEICAQAEAARAEEHRYERLRRAVSLMRRDLAGLAQFGYNTRPELTIWDAFSDLAALTARKLRRTLSLGDLKQIEAELIIGLDNAREFLDPTESGNMSTSAVDTEQHIQNSNKEPHVSEPTLEKVRGEPTDQVNEPEDQKLPNVPLGLVTTACEQIQAYVPDKIRHWHQLVRAAEVIRPMMGISPDAWDHACSVMGDEEAAVVVVAMLERFEEIQSPGGYLRHLTNKAADGRFSCGPMVMALMRKDAA